MRRWTKRLALALLCVLLLPVLIALPRSDLQAPPSTPLLADTHGRHLAQLGTAQDAPLGYWPIEGETPWRIAAAVLAIEDRRFSSHPGVDPLAIARALRDNLRSGRRISGASTVAMQVARMQSPGDRTWSRKLIEATTALLLTARHGRQAVLRHYLRIVPYGNRIRGIQYAARRYLDKPIADLSWAEIAFLAAIPQSPSHTSPYTASGAARAKTRARRILDQLRDDGLLSRTEHDQACSDLANIPAPRPAARPAAAMHTILRIEASADTLPTMARATLDLDLQREVQESLRAGLLEWRKKGAGNGAVMVVSVPQEPGEGFAVRAAVGSADWHDDAWAGAIDYTTTPRYPGSTIKPFLYALALDRGDITPATVLEDLQRGPEGLDNADHRYLGPLLPRQALAGSRNIPAVHLLQRIGLDAGYDFLRQLGLHNDEHPADHWGLSMAIGGFPVTLEALTTAATALVDGGRLHTLRWLEGETPPPPQRVFSAASARTVTRILSDPLARLPSFPRMGFTEFVFPVAVKTGTSSGYRDALTIAWSEAWLVAVWIGHPDYREMAGLSGYRVAANLTQTVMNHLHADRLDGLSDHTFPPPEGYEAAPICALSGAAASPRCDTVFTEHFPPGTAPLDPCPVHRRLQLDTRTGDLATAATPRRYIVEEVFADLPARYADWGARQGLRRPPASASTLPGEAPLPQLSIRAPVHGARLVRDPEAPRGRATLALQVAVDPPVETVLWLVDGTPFATVGHPYTVRWPLAEGAHRFQATVPHTEAASAVVEITLQ
ncbi:MAG: transglycosylase domain-containing protein [Myxococcota bacterium]|nr:transglycosylase domain-containing protein [Myxococcota bacterium]